MIDLGALTLPFEVPEHWIQAAGGHAVVVGIDEGFQKLLSVRKDPRGSSQMTYGIYVAAAGAVARRNQVDIVANNIANASTPGYRSQSVTFESVLRDARAPDRHLVRSSETQSDSAAGTPIRTGRPGDFMVRGSGYIGARTASGQVTLLRTGSLQIDAEGLLSVDGRFRVVDPLGGFISLDPNLPFEVSEDGTIEQAGEMVGRLDFRSVADGRHLEILGGGAFSPTDASGDSFAVHDEVVTGHVEGSNVKPLEGMVKLIDLERGFQASMKVIQAYREADEQLIERTT